MIIFFIVKIFIEKELFSNLIGLFNLIVPLLAAFIALIIPFVMKDLDKKSQRSSEIELIKLAYKRLDGILNISPDLKNTSYPSPELPFFTSIAKNNPNILIKLGLEVQTSIDPRSGRKVAQLYLLDKYRLYFGANGLVFEKIDFYLQYRQINTWDLDINQILQEIKDYIKNTHKIKIEDEENI